jgi:hypothetical protein
MAKSMVRFSCGFRGPLAGVAAPFNERAFLFPAFHIYASESISFNKEMKKPASLN